MSKLVVSHNLAAPVMDYLRKQIDEVVVADSADQDILLSHLKDADAAIIRIGSITGEMLRQCPNLKVIGRSGVGYDDIDIVSATEQGIPVTITPGGNARAVAEHTFTLILAAAKNIVRMDIATREGDFYIRNTRNCVELYEKTLFLIGFGHIGKLVASYADAFGMKVAVYDPFLASSVVEGMGYQYVPVLEEGVKEADVISLHIPMTEETKGLFDVAMISKMKKNSILVNCARGGIIDEEALISALGSGHLYAAGTDVFSVEPPPQNLPLLKAENLTISPHNASLTEEAVISVHQMCAESIVSVIQGNKWEKVADRRVYEHSIWRYK
ncbi:MAG: hydroxyacid dehydrogenase [Sphaerochaetaceae bacterium]|nr:hydroxyacid dehydrogenase [Sphaerochaetaceae bacterium]